jgi:hypothetical protein
MGKAHADTLYAIEEHFASIISKFFWKNTSFFRDVFALFTQKEDGR